MYTLHLMFQFIIVVHVYKDKHGRTVVMMMTKPSFEIILLVHALYWVKLLGNVSERWWCKG